MPEEKQTVQVDYSEIMEQMHRTNKILSTQSYIVMGYDSDCVVCGIDPISAVVLLEDLAKTMKAQIPDFDAKLADIEAAIKTAAEAKTKPQEVSNG